MLKILKMFPVALALLAFAPVAHAFDVNAGPIWNDTDAQGKCPSVCQWYGGWNGNWVTTVSGQMSVCGCNVAPQGGLYDANAGPIWNNDDAKGKCLAACQWYGGWNGNWVTTVPNQMSVCGCNQAVKS